MEFKKQSHCVYHCKYHVVLPTKYRRQVFNPELEFETVNHDVDHVHFMVSVPPKMSISQVIRIVKANTSKSMKQKFDYLKKLYWGTDGIWSEGYCVSTVGINEEIIRQYIENQGKEDTGQAMLELS